MKALDTARFSLEHEREGSTELFPGAYLILVGGRVDMPRRYEIVAEGTLGKSSFLEIHVVAVDGRAYMTDPFTGRWNEVDASGLPFDFADLGTTLGDILRSLNSVSFVGTEQIGGATSWRVKGTMLSEGLSGLVPTAAKGFEVELELWIGQAEGLLRKVRIAGQIYSTDLPDVVRVLTVDRFDEPVEISLPDISE